jgi:hypothetical protein
MCFLSKKKCEMTARERSEREIFGFLVSKNASRQISALTPLGNFPGSARLVTFPGSLGSLVAFLGSLGSLVAFLGSARLARDLLRLARLGSLPDFFRLGSAREPSRAEPSRAGSWTSLAPTHFAQLYY